MIESLPKLAEILGEDVLKGFNLNLAKLTMELSH